MFLRKFNLIYLQVHTASQPRRTTSTNIQDIPRFYRTRNIATDFTGADTGPFVESVNRLHRSRHRALCWVSQPTSQEPTQGPLLSQSNPVHILISYFCKIHFNVILASVANGVGQKVFIICLFVYLFRLCLEFSLMSYIPLWPASIVKIKMCRSTYFKQKS
jgi:hypothetical protein